MKKLTTLEFIEKAKMVHGSKYNYSQVEYVHSHNKIKIVCPEHGLFLQGPSNHLAGNGCKRCIDAAKRSTLCDFVTQANTIHAARYDYSLVEYVNTSTKINIVCKLHGMFSQPPRFHLLGVGCPICANNIQHTTLYFINQAKLKHGELYDYSLTKYVSARNKIEIICMNHGPFLQWPNSHLNGSGCPKCACVVSKPEETWLNYHQVPNTPTNRQVKLRVGKSRFNVDGYVPETNTVYEFNGDFWHGNPLKHKSTDFNPRTSTTYGELYEKTLLKQQLIINAGYNLIKIWESDWKSFLVNSAT